MTTIPNKELAIGREELVLKQIAYRTGQLGAAGFAKEFKAAGIVTTQIQARRMMDELLEKRLLTTTPGTPYLCVTVEGYERLRKLGML